MLDFLTLAPKLQELLKAGQDFYAMAQSDQDRDVEAVARFIERASAGWNPVIRGQTFLDDAGTRAAGARFLAGIAVRTAKGSRRVA